MARVKSEVITVIGKRGTGKTFMSVWVAKQMSTRFKIPIYAINRMNDKTINGIVPAERRAGSFNAFVQILKKSKKGNENAVLNVQDWRDERYFFRFFEELKIPALLLVDEIDSYCRGNTIDPGLYGLINYGRHWGVTIIGNARRTANVSKDITAASDLIVSFRQTERLDLDRLKNFTDQITLIKTLNDKEFLPVGDGSELQKTGLTLDKVQKIVNLKVCSVNKS